jgi:hypothetical protein
MDMRLTKAMKAVLKQMQSNGGKARARNLSPERRRQIARLAVEQTQVFDTPNQNFGRNQDERYRNYR